MYTASNTWRWHLDLADDAIENLDSVSALSFGTHSALSFRCLVIADSDLVWVRSPSISLSGFKRTVYRKKTFSGAYTAWDSFGPTRQKVAVIKSLVSRAKRPGLYAYVLRCWNMRRVHARIQGGSMCVRPIHGHK